MSISGGRFLYGMSRLYQKQHRNTSNISTKAYTDLYHNGTNSSRRLHFHHSFSSTTDSKQPLALSILFFGHRHLHCQHSLGKPHQEFSSTFLQQFPTNHQRHQRDKRSHRNSCSCACLKVCRTSSSLFRCYSRIAEMSSVHLAKGSVCPPLQDGKLRIYNMKFCPFAQRALLAAEAKGIPYDIVNCNLTDKPEWLFEKHPEGKVPLLESNDGKILYESLIVADYLDEINPSQRPLHPKDAYKKALDRILLEKFSPAVSSFHKILYAIRDSEPNSVIQERLAEFVQSFKPFEEELSKRGTIFYGGNDQPGMLDYMIWPWFERIPAVKSKLPDLFDYDAAKVQNPNLEKWRQAMKKDSAVAAIILPPELHLQFLESFIAGSPNYDL